MTKRKKSICQTIFLDKSNTNHVHVGDVTSVKFIMFSAARSDVYVTRALERKGKLSSILVWFLKPKIYLDHGKPDNYITF